MLQLNSKPGWILENLWSVRSVCFVPEMQGRLQKQVACPLELKIVLFADMSWVAKMNMHFFLSEVCVW
jgi:hypothetical protein